MHQKTERPKFAHLLSASATAYSFAVITAYAAMCLLWAGFSHWLAPSIAAAAYAGKIPTILNWSFHSSSPLPLEHYIDVWNTLSRAVELALILHLVLVLLIRAIDEKHFATSNQKTPGTSGSNFIFFAFSAVFLASCIIAGPRGDYVAYIVEWRDVLEGRDPWHVVSVDNGASFNVLNDHGPFFNVLAPFIWITPLANKLLFAFAYLAYIIWLVKDFGRDRGLLRLLWPVIIFWLANPFAWIEIAVYGHLDVLVALTCVVAVHGQVRGKDAFSGTCLGIGVLLKFLPVVIFPFLVLNKRRIHFGLLGSCAALVIAGFGISVVIWGTSTFAPLMFAAGRKPAASIYELVSAARFSLQPAWDGSNVNWSEFLYSANFPLRPFWDTTNLGWLEKPLGLAAGLSVFAWCMMRRVGPALSAVLAVLVTLLFYRLGYVNYQMVLFLLVSYWAVSRWRQLKGHYVLTGVLVAYFGFLAVVDIAIWSGVEGYGHYSMFVVSLKFLLGCVLLASLIRFSDLAKSATGTHFIEDHGISVQSGMQT
jgi:hypothetical protein